jgi:hypothetical protein
MFDLEHTLDQLHSSVINRRLLQFFSVFVRCLLALGFIPPSIPKILHRPFTILPETNPVGAYFHALYNTGFYYEFIGWSQIVAAVLLLIPRTAHIGAFMFLPIVVNIAVLTCSVGFKGTWLVTIFMSFAALWLTAWEYDRLKPLLFRNRSERPRGSLLRFIYIPAFFAAGGAAIGVLWWLMRLGNFSNYVYVGGILVLGGSVFGLVVALHYHFMPVGRLKERREAL